jgi:hypothetical protein
MLIWGGNMFKGSLLGNNYNINNNETLY